jgi:hypothetical protein
VWWEGELQWPAGIGVRAGGEAGNVSMELPAATRLNYFSPQICHIQPSRLSKNNSTLVAILQV